MDLFQHPIVARVSSFLQVAGVDAWLVGGVVRDARLGRTLHDLDFAVEGDGVSLARRIADRLGGAFVALDVERQVGRVVLEHAGETLFVDLAALRGDGGIEADLWLRDFSINALAVEVPSGTLIDPTGGAGDIEGARIRAVSERVFQDDPLRMLRAVRLAGQLSFEIAASTEALIRRDADQIVRPAGERVREELLALLAPPDAAARVGQLDALDLLAHVLPELDACKGVTQSPPHTYDVYDHNLAVLDALEELLDPIIRSPALAPPSSATLRTPRRETFERAVDVGGGPEGPAPHALRTTHPRPAPNLWGDSAPLAPWREQMAQHLAVQVAYEQPRWLLLKLAALLHDVGKPPTRSVGEDGRIHFYRHDSAGARLVEALLRRLKMPANSVAWVSRIVAAHLRPLHLSSRESPRRRSLYRYFQASGAAGPDVALLSIADQRGKGFVEDRAAVVAVAQRILEGYFDEHEKLVAVRPLLDGAAIMATVGIEPGPRVGQLLARLKEAQASGHVRDRESAIKYIRDLTAR